ncbi:hypothetical protein [Bradyrhizobium sp. AUGA SZCCT0283]|uniref:hypothetical protein n=1 Tax=Bradyrhizobium sp. AUGA SZCCT0283 TaxID=2807671 RepID=UPI001BADBF44|nr:hypothetical protein [Bradyrhizobium sp. AUGA SZCCT0283]MBR1275619.1 hypothetical protein [Bradyrhizobium sp. AUGA SZCCT0283]
MLAFILFSEELQPSGRGISAVVKVSSEGATTFFGNKLFLADRCAQIRDCWRPRHAGRLNVKYISKEDFKVGREHCDGVEQSCAGDGKGRGGDTLLPFSEAAAGQHALSTSCVGMPAVNSLVRMAGGQLPP